MGDFKFKLGDCVDYKGERLLVGMQGKQEMWKDVPPTEGTFIWQRIEINKYKAYVIQHHEGIEIEWFINFEMQLEGKVKGLDCTKLNSDFKYVICDGDKLSLHGVDGEQSSTDESVEEGSNENDDASLDEKLPSYMTKDECPFKFIEAYRKMEVMLIAKVEHDCNVQYENESGTDAITVREGDYLMVGDDGRLFPFEARMIEGTYVKYNKNNNIIINGDQHYCDNDVISHIQWLRSELDKKSTELLKLNYDAIKGEQAKG